MYSQTEEFGSSRLDLYDSDLQLSTVETLLCEDTAVARTKLYLRMLYSQECARLVRNRLEGEGHELSRSTLALLSQIDWDGLKHEQAARLRNLYAQLLRRSLTLTSTFSSARLQELLIAFTDSPAFWRCLGRTLLENFAFAVYGCLINNGEIYEAEVLRLTGLISGVHSKSDLPSPWASEDLGEPGSFALGEVEHVESFVSSCTCVNSNGQIIKASERDKEFMSSQRVFVMRLSSKEVAVLAISL